MAARKVLTCENDGNKARNHALGSQRPCPGAVKTHAKCAHLEHKALRVALDVQNPLHPVDVVTAHLEQRAHPQVEPLQIHRAIDHEANARHRVIVDGLMVHVAVAMLVAVIVRGVGAAGRAVCGAAVRVRGVSVVAMGGLAVAMSVRVRAAGAVAVLRVLVVASGGLVRVVVAVRVLVVRVRVAVGGLGLERCQLSLHLQCSASSTSHAPNG